MHAITPLAGGRLKGLLVAVIVGGLPCASAQEPPALVQQPIQVVWGSYLNNEDFVDGGASRWITVQQNTDACLLHGAYWNYPTNSIGSPSPDVSTDFIMAVWQEAVRYHPEWTSKEFFGYRGWSGDGSFTVRLDSLEYSNAARTNAAGGIPSAGIMLPESTAAGARQVSLLVNLANQLKFRSRASTGGLTPVPGSGSPIANLSVTTEPRWLRLARTGSAITA